MNQSFQSFYPDAQIAQNYASFDTYIEAIGLAVEENRG